MLVVNTCNLYSLGKEPPLFSSQYSENYNQTVSDLAVELTDGMSCENGAYT